MELKRYFLRLATLGLALPLLGCGSSTKSWFGASGGRSAVKTSATSCPAVALISGLTIDYTPSIALPSELALAINGELITYDSCTQNQTTHPSPVSIQTSGNALQISVPIDGSSQLYSAYFSPNSESPPINNQIGFQLYGRDSCSAKLKLIASPQGLVIPWEPVLPYGSACGVYGYRATITAP
jgi:hypothetical protein